MNTIGPCECDQITPGVVQFDPVAFQAAFPAFATVSTTVLTANFAMATLLLNNSCCSAVRDAPTRSALLNLIVAHITQLLQGANGEPPSGLVGRIGAAGQGSVNVNVEWASTVSMSEAYWSQTQYGAMFWQMALPYRSAFYMPPQGDTDGWGAWPQ